MEGMQKLRVDNDDELRRLDDISTEQINQYIILVRFIDSNWYVRSFEDYKSAKNLYHRLKAQNNVEIYWLWRLK